ncbi:unnamed protein product [Psylliodes chrysocephalus]|uniref:DUF4371 domain-containing protein n=1 Tax=Psylliodes chrysocephalus TaxID=3402493 RepID=A0A9P0GAE3_9CUCU|nr:unnamed protein product [Psylliodes chrysocephala]
MELNDCNFSIQVDDSTDIVQKSQYSTIIRYVNSQGKLVERFLVFHDVSCERTAEALFTLVTSCLEKYDSKSKLVGQCYDGASVMSEQLDGLQSKIKKVTPEAVFVQCLAHRLNLVLSQSYNSISKCRIFFANVNGLPSFFFHHLAKRTHAADVILNKRIPTSVVTRWSSNSKILSLIHNNWNSLKQVFIDILNDPNSNKASIRQSQGYLNMFNGFEFVLLVIIFNEFFSISDVLFDVLQKRSLDINYCVSQIKNAQNQLNTKRSEVIFANIIDSVSLRTELPTEHRDGRIR